METLKSEAGSLLTPNTKRGLVLFQLFATVLFTILLPCTLLRAELTPAELPDAPAPQAGQQSAVSSGSGTRQAGATTANSPAPRLAKYIEPGQQAVHLNGWDKIELSGWEQVQPYSISTQILAAAWEHLLNGNPKYGSDKAGFGERVGAAALRQTSQAVFSDGVLPAIFHQDPRYYRKGEGSIMSRAAYSATRVIIIRGDSGDEQPNYSQVIGYAGAAALTMTYYPAISATWHDTAEGYGISLVTAALGNQLHEFGPDIIKLTLHRKKKHADTTP